MQDTTGGEKFGGATDDQLVDFTQQLKATEGSLEPDPEPGSLSLAHEEYLASQAIDVELARFHGVRSLTSREDTADLPEPWDSWANFPAILFPWTSPDGRVEYQVRPDTPTPDRNGRARKYVFRKGMVPVLWEVSRKYAATGPGRVLIVEGTKQCLAAASYGPPGWSVYGIAGCRMWQQDGVPIPDLAVVDGREVVIILDADAAGNADVYAAGMGLAEALAIEGATSVKFARLPASGKAGLDDVLIGRPPERRAGYLARIIDGAKARPADTKPRAKRKDETAPVGGNRVTLVCNRDRLEVINDLTAALIERWDGEELFNHGGVISRLRDGAMVPIDRGASRDLIQETAITVNENTTAQGTQYDYTWPDTNSISAVLSRAEKFSPLEQVAHAPFVRPDGSIVTEPGYDEATRTVLVPDPDLIDLEVPGAPSDREVSLAQELILKEWLGDFPFDTDADRANALALILTPAVRGLVPRVPLAVVDGLQMGVGKNLLADSILTVYTGEAARPMNFVDEKEELRKQITSAFRTGAQFFVFDEAHTIEGAALAQALTAATWQDRILGVSNMAEFPNRVTWMSLGNQVQVRGDLTRRVYRIALRPPYANPQDRPASSFRHPGQSGLDLGSWTRAHRRDLMRAILTLVRAWFAAGSPVLSRGVSFGSFEAWERIVGGIVEHAGLSGFLGNLTVWRSESDFDSQYWAGHLTWLSDQFGDEPFRTAQVKSKAMADPAAYLAPPRLDDPSEKGYSKALGEAYARQRGRRHEGAYIERLGNVRGHVSLWRVVTEGDQFDTGGGTGGTSGTSYPPDSQNIPPIGGRVGGSPTESDDSGGSGASDTRESGDSVVGESPEVPPVPSSGVETRESGDSVVGESPEVPPVPSFDGMGYDGTHEGHRDSEAGGREAGPAGLDGGGRLPSSGAVSAVPDVDGAAGQDASPSGDVRPGAGGGGVPAQAGAARGEADRMLDGVMPGGPATEVPQDLPRPKFEQGPVPIYAPPEVKRPITSNLVITEVPITSELATFDLETGDAGDLYRSPGREYVRLAGWAADDGTVEVQRWGAWETVQVARYSAMVTGHNIMAFDLPALVRADQGLTMTEVHHLAKEGRLFDALLVARYLDPPMAREKGVDATRKYDLNTLGVKFGLGEKHDAAKVLAEKYGGWGNIPIDDESEDGRAFRAYLVQDVELSRALYRQLLGDLGGQVPPYLVREHRVAALATQISLNGFRVDVPELERRVEEINLRKARAYQFLNLRHGIPLADARGKPYKAPLGTKSGKEALERALREAGATTIWKTEKTDQIDVSGDHMRYLAMENHHLPAVRAIAKAVYRIVSARTVYETVANHLCPDGRVHPRVSFKQATGRWSLTEPGLTVMGKHGGRHVEREILLPDPGEVVVTVDLSQVDMRAVAGLSQDQAYIEMLKRDDPHSEIAQALFGDAKFRQKAKAIGHGWNYGRGMQAISEREDIEPKLVRQFDESMRARFPRLVEWQNEVRAIAESGELLDNGFGRKMRPDPRRAHTQGPALMGQGAARDLMMEGLLRLADQAPDVLPMLRAQVHDEIVLSVPEDQVEDVRRAVVDALTFEWRGVPILADASPVGETWGHVYAK